MTYTIPADSSTVTAYYEEHLSGGAWSITGRDSSCGCINFARTDGTQGKLQVQGTGTSARLEVQFHKLPPSDITVACSSGSAPIRPCGVIVMR